MGRHIKFIAVLLAISPFLVSGCSDKKEEETKVEKPVEQVYNEAWDHLTEGKNQKAIDGFDEVEKEYPYSDWATRARIMSAYANYKKNDYDSASPILETFVKQHPANKNTPYAYYLMALCYYEQISDVGRDQKITEQALAALQDVMRRFPDSDYAKDAKVKVDLVNDHLAGKEMEIGRYYQNRGEILAAINRYRFVIEKYQTTTHTPEALHRLVEGYYSMGAIDEAQKYGAVLGHNYPDSKWYKRSYAILKGLPEMDEGKKESFIRKMFN